MSNQSERIVLITGGSSGIGFEMAKQMAAQQSTVIICGRSQEKLDVVEIFYPAVDTPFQNGHAPDHAIKPDEAAAIALEELNRGKEDIRVKRAGLLFIASRLMPKRALNLLNGRIPDNVEELLAREK
jgi:uncharacterized oxidoreductase